MNSWITHQISNQFDELKDYNLFESDSILQEILLNYGSRNQAQLAEFGHIVGSNQYYEYAELANTHTPILHQFDPRGRRMLLNFILLGTNGWL